MKFLDEFRDPELVRGLLDEIGKLEIRATLMEVCGTHTMAIAKAGLRKLLPQSLRLISGPGCPVCVTPQSDIDAFIALGKEPGFILTTFGDMLRVPGRLGSLETARAKGVDVRIVYSPMDALEIARRTPDHKVIFFAVGFETTAPTTALTVKTAAESDIENFSVYTTHKLIPPALEAIASDPRIEVNGFICPGHVSVIIGSDAYKPIAEGRGISCVVAGFEPADILQAILTLTRQIASGESRVESCYSRAVTPEGNHEAQKAISDVFQQCDAEWRGLGIIPDSGLALRDEYSLFDAARLPVVLEIKSHYEETPIGYCRCGDVLCGLILPDECSLFGSTCTPEFPVGPCMVSSEGACAAAYKYGTD